MQIILKEDAGKLGKFGDIVRVKDGYARNYLIPRGIASEATPQNLKSLEHENLIREARKKKQKQSILNLADKISSISITIPMQAGEDERIFGSVTSGDIGEALSKEGIDIDRRKIELEEPLKKLGIYQVDVALDKDVSAKVKVWIVET